MADTTHMSTDRQQLSSRSTTTADSNDNMAVKIVEQLLLKHKHLRVYCHDWFLTTGKKELVSSTRPLDSSHKTNIDTQHQP